MKLFAALLALPLLVAGDACDGFAFAITAMNPPSAPADTSGNHWGVYSPGCIKNPPWTFASKAPNECADTKHFHCDGGKVTGYFSGLQTNAATACINATPADTCDGDSIAFCCGKYTHRQATGRAK